VAFDQEQYSAGQAIVPFSAFSGVASIMVVQMAGAIEAVGEQEKHVTRPYDDSFAVLSLKNLKGEILCATDHFLLSSIVEGDQERSSARMTLGDPSLYVGAGRNPKIYSYGGFLVDTETYGPMISFWRQLYEKFFRGTMCAKKNAYVELTTRDFYRRGYLTAYSLGVESSNIQLVPLNFTMFVIREASWK